MEVLVHIKETQFPTQGSYLINPHQLTRVTVKDTLGLVDHVIQDLVDLHMMALVVLHIQDRVVLVTQDQVEQCMVGQVAQLTRDQAAHYTMGPVDPLMMDQADPHTQDPVVPVTQDPVDHVIQDLVAMDVCVPESANKIGTKTMLLQCLSVSMMIMSLNFILAVTQ